MRQLEGAIERKACANALLMGVDNIKLKAIGKNGWPDRLFLIPGGRPLLIEFKRFGERTRKLQDYIHGNLRALGYQVEAHDTVDGALQAIRKALDAARLSEKKR